MYHARDLDQGIAGEKSLSGLTVDRANPASRFGEV
jgi:hypothetical protein